MYGISKIIWDSWWKAPQLSICFAFKFGDVVLFVIPAKWSVSSDGTGLPLDTVFWQFAERRTKTAMLAYADVSVLGR